MPNRVRVLTSILLDVCAFCACQIECETCIQSYLIYAILCVPNRLRDIKSILLNMCVFCVCRIECETWGSLAWHVCFLSVLNGVRHLKSILLDMCVFCSCRRVRDLINHRWHMCFLNVPNRVRDFKTTSSPSSSCERSSCGKKRHGENIKVCMEIFTTVLSNEKYSQILNGNNSL